MGLLGDITQFSGIGLLKKHGGDLARAGMFGVAGLALAKKKKKTPALTAEQIATGKTGKEVIDPAAVISTEETRLDADDFSGGFKDQAAKLRRDRRG
jgi:hypothetical protein